MASQSWTEGLIDDMLVAAVGMAVVIAVLFFSGNFALASYRKMATSEGQLRQLSDALTTSETRLRLITDSVPALISYVDHEQRYRFNNKAYYELTGIDPTQIAGMTIREVFGEENYVPMRIQIDAALQGESISVERKIVSDGKTRYFHCEYIPERGQDGKITGFYIMAIDITDRQIAEKRLAESERRQRAITDNVNGSLKVTQLPSASAIEY